MFIKKRISKISIVILISTAFFGCTKNPEPDNANIVNKQPATVKNDNASVNKTESTNVNAAVNPMNGTSAAGSNDSKTRANVPVVKVPPPVVGSGASDLMLFTQVRGALGAEPEFQTAVIIEVKEGNVVLSGKVSSAARKTEAAQLAQKVSGVKSVKNNLTVAP